MNQEIERMLEELVNLGKVDPEMMNRLLAASQDPETLDAIIAQLNTMGAHEVGSGPPPNIEDFYREGSGKFSLRWPLHSSDLLPFPFDELDRKTQFFVLFGDWSRRELEGMIALNNGESARAEEIFQECLQRAEQLEVAELKARSYEGLMRLAQRRGDRQAERNWLQKAAAARA